MDNRFKCHRCCYLRFSQAEPDMAFCILDNLERVNDQPYHMVVRSLPPPAKRSVVLIPAQVMAEPTHCTTFRPTRRVDRLVALADADDGLMDDTDVEGAL